jgi:hypothetical protein
LEVAQTGITAVAQEATHPVGQVAVVDMRRAIEWSFTDGTYVILSMQQVPELLDREAVAKLKVMRMMFFSIFRIGRIPMSSGCADLCTLRIP